MNQNEQTVERVFEYLSGLSIMKKRTSGKVYFPNPEGFTVMDITGKSRNAYGFRKFLPIPEEFDETQASEITAEAIRLLSEKRSIRFSTGWVCFLDNSAKSEKEVYDSMPDSETRDYIRRDYIIRNGMDKLVPVK